MSELDLNMWERALGWRKRQMIQRQLDPVSNQIRNNTLEEEAMISCKLFEPHLFAFDLAHAMFLDLIQPLVFVDVGSGFVCNPRGKAPYFSLYLCAAHPSL